MKSIQKISPFVLILLLAGMAFQCGQPNSAAQASEERVFPVRVQTVGRADIENKIAYLGNLEAVNEVNVYSRIPEKITELKVDVNDRVLKGDVLATVNNVTIQQGVVQAEAGLKSAKAQYDNVLTEWNRIQRLFKEKAVSQSQYDAVKAQKEAAEAAVSQLNAGLKSAKEQLADTYIKAPISGIISMRNYDVGDQTVPQLPVFTIVQMDQVKILIDIVESEIAQIKPGLVAHIYVDTYPGEVFDGRITKVYPTINPMTRTLKCEIVIDNRDDKLKPGGFARVEIVTDVKENVVVVPKHAIIEKTSLKYLGGEVTNNEIIVTRFVFTVENEIAEMREIETGIISANQVEVISGLAAGQRVVTIGQHELSDSAKVEVTEEGN